MIRTAWRIVKAQRIATAFTGDGARRNGGRWNSRGTRLVYAASSWSLALLEVLVHLETPAPTGSWVAIPVEFDDRLMETLDDVPDTWRAEPAAPDSQRVGDAWVQGARSAVLTVPSMISPAERTLLLNPAHPEFRHLRIGTSQPVRMDPRLLRFRQV